MSPETSREADCLIVRERVIAALVTSVAEVLIREYVGDAGEGCDGSPVPWVEGPAYDVAETAVRLIADGLLGAS